MLSILIALAATAGETQLPNQWAQFSRSPPGILLKGVSETVDIASGDRNNDNNFPYKLRLTSRAHRGKTEIKWTDSARCPAVRAVVTSMIGIKMPSPSPFGVRGRSEIIETDSTEYSLTAPSSDTMGTVTVNAIDGSALAAWVDASLKQLEPCWRAAAS